MISKEVTQFWDWIGVNINSLESDKITNNFINLLDNEIQKLGDFAWEIGYDDTVDKHFLTISSEGNSESDKEIKTILSLAPKIDDWIFYSHKPPKQWKFILELLIDGVNVQFDASEWQYVIYKYPDNVYDIIIKIPLSYQIYEEYFYSMGLIAVSAELGETFVNEYINDIDLVFEFNEKEKGKATSFKYLRSHILT
ncbi:hypothetical protein [Elizabethkingia anophelis]|uniref:hypothetical protein n=1 Tax=Elizabethkingia anophelis TaxID=1117645 RepID=UPI00301DCB8B